MGVSKDNRNLHGRNGAGSVLVIEEGRRNERRGCVETIKRTWHVQQMVISLVWLKYKCICIKRVWIHVTRKIGTRLWRAF